MGFNDLKAKGIAYIEAGKNDQLLAEVKKAAAAENLELKNELATLRKMLEDLTNPDKESGKKKAS